MKKPEKSICLRWFDKLRMLKLAFANLKLSQVSKGKAPKNLYVWGNLITLLTSFLILLSTAHIYFTLSGKKYISHSQVSKYKQTYNSAAFQLLTLYKYKLSTS